MVNQLTRYKRIYQSSLSKIMEEVNPQLKGNFKEILEKLSEYGFESIAKLAGVSEDNYKSLLTFLSKNWSKLKTRSSGEISHDLVEPLKTFLSKNPPLALKNLSLETLNTYKGIKKEVETGKGIQVIMIDDPETCIRLTDGSGWCVQQEEYANTYLQDGPLYMVLRNGKRFALLHFETNSFMDVHDNPLKQNDVDWIKNNSPEMKELFQYHLNPYMSNQEIQYYLKNVYEGGVLDLDKSRITEFPAGLHDIWSLSLWGCKITNLPDDLYIDGDLDLRYSSITELPNGLWVTGSLYLSGTKVSRLPNDLQVEGTLYADYSGIQEEGFVKPSGVKGDVSF